MVVLVSVGAGFGKHTVGASIGKPNTETVVVNFRPGSVRLVPARVVVMAPDEPAVRSSVSAGSWNCAPPAIGPVTEVTMLLPTWATDAVPTPEPPDRLNEFTVALAGTGTDSVRFLTDEMLNDPAVEGTVLT